MSIPGKIALRVSSYNRSRKWRLFLDYTDPSPATTVLDVGFSGNEYHPDDNYIEKHYPYPDRLVALGIDAEGDFESRYPRVAVVRYDGVRFPFSDGQFDVCWSNAVLEHVGSFPRQVEFVKEMKRVAKRLFFTTPNRMFPVEVHTKTPLLHYLPQPLFFRYLALTGREWATGDYMHLLTKRKLRAVLDAAAVHDYRIVSNRILGLALDFVVLSDPTGSSRLPVPQ